MAQRKGQTGNPYGRPKGSPNRNTKEIKTAFQNLLDANVLQMESDLKKLSPKDRINVLLKLAEFILPKIKDTESDLSEKELMLPPILTPLVFDTGDLNNCEN